MSQCTVSLRPCANPSSLQSLLGPVQAWLNDAGRYAQARRLSVNECSEPSRPDASAREELRCPFLATVGDLVGGATGRLWPKAGVDAREKD